MSLEILSNAAPGEDTLASFAGDEFTVSPEVPLMESVDTEWEFSGIVGRSSGLRNVLQLVEMVAATDSTVLLVSRRISTILFCSSKLPTTAPVLFEAVVNAVHRMAPQAAIAFNTCPEDSGEAAARWI